MTPRRRLYVFFLWWSVIGFSIWAGGTLFSMTVIVPMWSESPPQSIYDFFGRTSFNKYIFNFFGPPWMAARNLPVLVALILGWHLRRQRNYLIVTLCCLVFGIVYTIVYIYPINDILMAQAGGNRTSEEIDDLVTRWIRADRIRFAIMMIGYFFLLKTFRMPAHDGAV